MRCVLEGCALLPWRVEHRLKKTFVEGVRFRVAQVGLRRFAQTFFLPPATSPPSPAPESRRGKASHRGHGASLRARIRQVYLSFRFAARRPRPFARVALHATRRRTRRAWRPVTRPGCRRDFPAPRRRRKRNGEPATGNARFHRCRFPVGGQPVRMPQLSSSSISSA